jgi:hypothetical protein
VQRLQASPEHALDTEAADVEALSRGAQHEAAGGDDKELKQRAASSSASAQRCKLLARLLLDAPAWSERDGGKRTMCLMTNDAAV